MGPVSASFEILVKEISISGIVPLAWIQGLKQLRATVRRETPFEEAPAEKVSQEVLVPSK